ncbi:MAG: nuclear transport factor 2 family protein [Crocinitomicaceae bacterium]|nr:nuclear transport factor 2 family protein [Crocinitomicaceae bacterium]
MKFIYVVLIAVFLLTVDSCGERQEHITTTDDNRTIIRQVMDKQQEDWNKGNIDGFMQGYWKSDSLQFVGKRGITLGWNSALNNYKESYPDAAAMGRLQFSNIAVEILCDDLAYATGKWELFRTSDTLEGHYSLLWKKLNHQWVIVSDHSS